MQPRRRNRKTEIFDRYSRNLQAVLPAFVDKYVCPLTLCVFERKDIDLLTREHCIPDGLGEPRIVLTEKKANNSAGAKIDVHLHRMLNYVEFFRDSVGQYAVRLRMGESVVGADVVRNNAIEGPRTNFQISAQRSDPAHVDASRISAENGDLPAKLRFTLSPNDCFVDRLAKVALIKSCYLELFYRLGYSLILHPIFNVVREQIRCPGQDVVPSENLVRQIIPADLLDDVFYVVEPEEFFAFGVDLKLRKNTGADWTCYRICLPCSSKSSPQWRDTQSGTFQLAKIPCGIDYVENPRQWIDYVPKHLEESER